MDRQTRGPCLLVAGCMAALSACSTTAARRIEFQDSPPPVTSEAPRHAFSAGLGFTDSPDTFLTILEFDWNLREQVVFAPMLQLGVGDDDTIIAPTADMKAYVPIPELIPLRLHALGGIGFVYLEKDDRRGDDEDAGFLVHFGFGGDYPLSEDVSLSSTFLFNVMPAEVLDERFFFSWELFSITFRF